jgi:hypothetical protein
VQYICHQRLRADGSKDTQTSSDEESEAEVEKEEEESDDEWRCDRTTAPVPKWEVLAGNRAVWVQLCQPLRLGQGSLGWRERNGCAVDLGGDAGGGAARVGLLGLQCSAGALLRGSSELINK